MEQLKFKQMFSIENPAYQNGNKLISQDVSFAFIRKPNFHILSWSSWWYLESADSSALCHEDKGMLLRMGLLTYKV